MTTPRQVQAALTREANKLNKAHRGTHIFNAIYPSEEPGCNWSATFRVVGSSLPLDVMREALERVQARYPVVEWP